MFLASDLFAYEHEMRLMQVDSQRYVYILCRHDFYLFKAVYMMIQYTYNLHTLKGVLT